MFLSEPARTDYDINFTLFGFPIRTHPAFFIMPILLGRGFLHATPVSNTGVGWLLLIAVFWVSILVHELGHAVAFRFYGIHARIVLYWFGGLAVPESSKNAWSRPQAGALTPGQQIVISLAGPIAGLLLAGLLCLLVVLAKGHLVINDANPIPFPQADLKGSLFANSQALALIFWSGIVINILLNLFNLIPIYPLDGGQVARQAMIQMDARDGLKNSVILSIACCLGLVLLSFNWGNTLMALFFGWMAWTNYQSLAGFSGRSW